MIYLDQAATSFPKPPEVVSAVLSWMVDVGVNPGRSAYPAAVRGARILYEAREAVAGLLGIRDSRRFVFTHNATHALNVALFGLLSVGDRVVATSMEHNAVMRPLRVLGATRGITVEVVPADAHGRVDARRIAAAVDDRTRLVVVNHASNVTGAVAPLAEIRRAIGAVPMLVDAAQSAGVLPIDVEADGIDLLAVTGHKGLLGPTGTGGLFVREGLEPEPLLFGGTGSSSSSDVQPPFWPDRHEGGTANGAGIAGLGAAAGLIRARGVETIREHETRLTSRLLQGLRDLQGVTVHGPPGVAGRTAVVSVTVEGASASTVARELARRWDIAVRAGLHCAPEAHRTIGTFPGGTVRLALGASNSDGDVDAVVDALATLAREAGS